MPRRQQDFQRSKCYAWERDLIEPQMKEELIEDLDEVRRFVDRVLAEHGITWQPDGTRTDRSTFTFYSKRRALVWWKKGSRGGARDAGGNCMYSVVDPRTGIPLFQELRVSNGLEIILHETGHLLLDQTRGARTGSGHDGTFVRALIELLSRYSTAWRGKRDELIQSARAAGLAVAGTSVLDRRWHPAEHQPATQEVAMAAKAPKKKAVKSTCETPGEIVRELATKNPDLKFGEIVKLAVARGVNPNTARGTLVRFKRGDLPSKKKKKAKRKVAKKAKRKTAKRKARKGAR